MKRPLAEWRPKLLRALLASGTFGVTKRGVLAREGCAICGLCFCACCVRIIFAGWQGGANCISDGGEVARCRLPQPSGRILVEDHMVTHAIASLQASLIVGISIGPPSRRVKGSYLYMLQQLTFGKKLRDNFSAPFDETPKTLPLFQRNTSETSRPPKTSRTNSDSSPWPRKGTASRAARPPRGPILPTLT